MKYCQKNKKHYMTQVFNMVFQHYHEDENRIIMNDIDISIDWPLDEIYEMTLSDKDKKWINLRNQNKLLKLHTT